MENLSTLFTRLVEAFELMAANQKQMADDVSRQVALLEATTKKAEQTETSVEVAKAEDAPKAPARKAPKRKAPAGKTAEDTPAELDLGEDEEGEAPKAPARKTPERKTAAPRKTASRSAAETQAPVVEYSQLSAAISELHAFSDEGAQAAINILKEYKVKNARFIPEEEWTEAIDKARNALEELIRIEEDEEDEEEDVLSMDLSEEPEDEEDEDDDFDFGDEEDDFDFDEEDED